MIHSDFSGAQQRKYERIIRGESPTINVTVAALVELARANPDALDGFPKEVRRAIRYLIRYGQEPSVGSGWTYNPDTQLVYSQNFAAAPRTLDEHRRIQALTAKEKEAERRARQNAKRQSAARLNQASNQELDGVRKFLTERTDRA